MKKSLVLSLVLGGSGISMVIGQEMLSSCVNIACLPILPAWLLVFPFFHFPEYHFSTWNAPSTIKFFFHTLAALSGILYALLFIPLFIEQPHRSLRKKFTTLIATMVFLAAGNTALIATDTISDYYTETLFLKIALILSLIGFAFYQFRPGKKLVGSLIISTLATIVLVNTALAFTYTKSPEVLTQLHCSTSSSEHASGTSRVCTMNTLAYIEASFKDIDCTQAQWSFPFEHVSLTSSEQECIADYLYKTNKFLDWCSQSSRSLECQTFSRIFEGNNYFLELGAFADASLEERISFCETTYSPTFPDSYQSCIEKHAIATTSPEMCDALKGKGITSATNHNNCVGAVAQELKSPEYCSLVTSTKAKEGCIQRATR